MLTIKTADLRALVTATLNQTPGKTYYGSAVRTAVNPYKVFSISRVNLGDLSRDDVDLCVDVYDRATDPKRVDEIADKIEELFNDANIPQPTILPTFFRESRYPVEEDEKDHQHIQLHFLVELYTLEE